MTLFEANLSRLRLFLVLCAFWSEWASWTLCSESCGGGLRIRERSCLNNVLFDCEGEPQEIDDCNVQVLLVVDFDISKLLTLQTNRARLCCLSMYLAVILLVTKFQLQLL